MLEMTNQGLPCSSELESLDEESDDVSSKDSSGSLEVFSSLLWFEALELSEELSSLPDVSSSSEEDECSRLVES